MSTTPFQADCARKLNGLRDYQDRDLRRCTCANCGVLRQFHWASGCKFRRMTDREWAEHCGVDFREVTERFVREVAEIEEPHAGGMAGLYKFVLTCGHRECRILPAVNPEIPKALKCATCAKENQMGWLNGKAKADVSDTPAQPVEPTIEALPAMPNIKKGITFTKAVKYNAKGRIALIGPGGSGKSYTMLLAARMLAGPKGRIAAVDTEHGSLSKYAGEFDFDVIELDSFSPQAFTETLHAAEDAGYDVFCCDSLSHFWTGKDGAFDFVDNAQRRQRDQQAGWKEYRPYERELVEAITNATCHVICTMRTKNAYENQTDPSNGKMKRVKVGLKPEQRDGIEYEFDLVGYMDEDNTFITDKTRCPAYAQRAIAKPGPAAFQPFVEWLQGSAREGRVSLKPVGQLDTGGNPMNSTAAAAYVAQQKLASATLAAPLKAPWKNMREVETYLSAIRERVGEVVWREHLDLCGWRELVDVRNAMGSQDPLIKATSRQKACELYWRLDALASKEGK